MEPSAVSASHGGVICERRARDGGDHRTPQGLPGCRAREERRADQEAPADQATRGNDARDAAATAIVSAMGLSQTLVGRSSIAELKSSPVSSSRVATSVSPASDRYRSDAAPVSASSPTCRPLHHRGRRDSTTSGVPGTGSMASSACEGQQADGDGRETRRERASHPAPGPVPCRPGNRQRAPSSSRPGGATPGAGSCAERGQRRPTCRAAGQPCPASTSEAVRPKSGSTHLAVRHLSTWRGDHAVAVQVSTPTELDAVPENRKRGVKAIQTLPHGAPHQHAAGGHAEPFLRLVTLTLVDLIDIELELTTTGIRNADTDLADGLAAVPMPRKQQLGSGEIDARVDRYVSEELIQRIRRRHGIVVQQPQPAGVVDRDSAEPDGVRVVLKIGGIEVQSGFDCCPESERSLPLVDRVEDAMPTCLVQQHRGRIGACIVDGDQPGGPGIQLGQCVQGRRQPARRVEGDQNSCDAAPPRCRPVRPRRRRSPPMPRDFRRRLKSSTLTGVAHAKPQSLLVGPRRNRSG